jgi:hypothetical protein
MPVRKGQTASAAVQTLLDQAARGRSAWYLAQRPVIAIWPVSIRGKVIWDVTKN